MGLFDWFCNEEPYDPDDESIEVKRQRGKEISKQLDSDPFRIDEIPFNYDWDD